MPGVPAFVILGTFGVDSPDGLIPRTEPRPMVAGAGGRFGCFRKGDSGRGRDGLDFGFSCGDGALAPGPTVWLKGCFAPSPTDWLNLGMDPIVGGVRLAGCCFRVGSNLLKAGVVGVGGKPEVDVEGERNLVALYDGRKMPAPETLTAK